MRSFQQPPLSSSTSTSTPTGYATTTSCNKSSSSNNNNMGSNHAHQFPNSSNFLQTPNPQCSNGQSNTHFCNTAQAVPTPHFPNFNNNYLPMQNGFMGFQHPGLGPSRPPSAQFYPQSYMNNPAVASQLLGNFQNVPPNLNPMAFSQPNGQWFPNPMQLQMRGNMPPSQFNFQDLQLANQIAGFPLGQFAQPFGSYPRGIPQQMMGLFNQGPQNLGSQNPSFPMIPQFGMPNSDKAVQNTREQLMSAPPAMNQQQLQGNSIQAQLPQTQKSMQPGACQRLQDDHGRSNSDNISNNNNRSPRSKNFSRNHPDSGKRGPENPRHQASNFHPMANGKRNFGLSGKGYLGKGANKHHMAKFTKQTKAETSRALNLSYSEQEIQEWRNARRKNHPSKGKIEKLADNQTHSNDDDARKRRQQLKEILAKQAELGVEVAELPPNYLSDTENQAGERGDNRTWTKNGRFQNKHGKRQKHCKDNRFVKKQKLAENGVSPMPVTNKKKPTLLQKLLITDIKRDNCHLLQAFRFMVLNSFFRDWPGKTLEFPLVMVKEMGFESVAGNKASSCQGDMDISGIRKNNQIEEIEELHDQHTAIDQDDNDDAETEEMVITGHVREIDCITKDIESSEGEEGEITE